MNMLQNTRLVSAELEPGQPDSHFQAGAMRPASQEHTAPVALGAGPLLASAGSTLVVLLHSAPTVHTRCPSPFKAPPLAASLSSGEALF